MPPRTQYAVLRARLSSRAGMRSRARHAGGGPEESRRELPVAPPCWRSAPPAASPDNRCDMSTRRLLRDPVPGFCGELVTRTPSAWHLPEFHISEGVQHKLHCLLRCPEPAFLLGNDGHTAETRGLRHQPREGRPGTQACLRTAVPSLLGLGVSPGPREVPGR